ncbi:MAG: hypothetical protein GX684_03135 [Ruminococcaceae bacterium]|nr:hypothetical protein [Oscillospiraceae bacterium]
METIRFSNRQLVVLSEKEKIPYEEKYQIRLKSEADFLPQILDSDTACLRLIEEHAGAGKFCLQPDCKDGFLAFCALSFGCGFAALFDDEQFSKTVKYNSELNGIGSHAFSFYPFKLSDKSDTGIGSGYDILIAKGSLERLLEILGFAKKLLCKSAVLILCAEDCSLEELRKALFALGVNIISTAQEGSSFAASAMYSD